MRQPLSNLTRRAGFERISLSIIPEKPENHARFIRVFLRERAATCHKFASYATSLFAANLV